MIPLQDNPEDCRVCFIKFDGTEHQPCTLPCGHTFCTNCITKMIEAVNISCPSHGATSDQFPINCFAEVCVKPLKTSTLFKPPKISKANEELSPSAEDLSSSKAGTVTPGEATLVTITFTLKKLLEEQKSRMMREMEDQQEMQSHLVQYRAQLADWTTQHHQLLDSLSDLVEQNKSALDLLKQEDSRVLLQMTNGQNVNNQRKAVLRNMESLTKAEEVYQVITQADHCMDEAQGWKKKCQEIFPDINTVTTSMKVFNPIFNLFILHIMKVFHVLIYLLYTRSVTQYTIN